MEAIRVSQSGPLTRTTSNNERLPFDVLGLIFHQYSLGSTYPLLKLETILLVCKAWTLAGLGHKTLWSRFMISIKTSESLRYWHRRVPIWVSRSPEDCLFDIEIVLDPDDTYFYMNSNSYFSGEEQLLLTSIALDLTGLEGQIARRWRSLRALGFYQLRNVFAPLLSFSTPNLIDLEIHWIESDDGGRLETPLLEKFHIEYSSCTYPNLENVTDLTICAEWRLQFDEAAVSRAQKLVKLFAYCNSTYAPLRGNFPLLEYLHLDFDEDEAFLDSFSASQLKTLSLRYADGDSYFWTSQCAGIQFQALERLELDTYPGVDCHDVDGDICNFSDGVHMVLDAAKNIQVLHTKSSAALEIVLKVLENLTAFQDHHFTLEYLECTMELCQGEARLDRIGTFLSEVALEQAEDATESDGKEGLTNDNE